VNAIAVDRQGDVYVTGDSLTLSTWYDFATIKYSNSGVPLWTNRYNGPKSSIDWPLGATVDESGCLFVMGCSSSQASIDIATIAYGASGTPLWTNRYAGGTVIPDTTPRKLIATGLQGDIVVLGSTHETDRSSTNLDYALIKYVSVPVAVAIASVGVGTNRLNFSGMPGSTYITQFTTNLQNTAGWLALSTNMPGSDSLWEVSDPAATNTMRFYRTLKQ
jgi:hypothetical protein